MKSKAQRIRWYVIKPFDKRLLRKLADGMLAAKFDDLVGFGFVIEDIRPNKITGKFVQKEKVTRIVINPSGESQEVHFDDFATTSFCFGVSKPQLEISNPARRISEFMTAVGDLLDDEVSIEPIEVGCAKWLDALSSVGCVVQTTRLVTESVAWSDRVTVNAVFTGASDIKRAANDFFKGRKINAKALAGTVAFDTEESNFKLSATGVITFPSPPTEALLRAIRQAAGSLIFD